MTRPSRDEWLMGFARAATTRGTCSRLAVGAVLVQGDTPIGAGYNGAPRGEEHCYHPPGADDSCLIAVHAEMNVLLNAAVEGHSTRGATMMITHSPCWACAGALIQAQIREVVYGEVYRSRSGLLRLFERGIVVRSLT